MAPLKLKVKVVRHLCPEGQRLYDKWDEALDTHEPENINNAMKAYFGHINGITTGGHCPECWVEILHSPNPGHYLDPQAAGEIC